MAELITPPPNSVEGQYFPYEGYILQFPVFKPDIVYVFDCKRLRSTVQLKYPRMSTEWLLKNEIERVIKELKFHDKLVKIMEEE